MYLTAIVSADTETDPGTFRTSSAEHQVLEHELARTVTDALSFNHSTPLTRMERDFLFTVRGNTEKFTFF